MINLYGCRCDIEYHRIGESGEEVTVRELVATFSTKELAKEYVSKSRLKGKDTHRYIDLYRGYYVFRAWSLLRSYEWAEIEDEEPDEVDHDPQPR